MSVVTKTIFRDLKARAEDARPSLNKERERLEKRNNKSKQEEKRLTDVKALLALAQDALLDPLFIAVKEAFNAASASGILEKTLKDHDDGVLSASRELTDEDAVRVALVTGILAQAQVELPWLKVGNQIAIVDPDDPRRLSFTEAFYAALGKANAVFPLAMRVFPLLRREGDPVRGRATPGEVSTDEFAGVMETLRARGISATEPQLRRRLNESLDTVQRVGIEPDIPQMTISIPNFTAQTNFQIVASNIDAMGPMICAAMFDELKAFDVVDHIVESAQNGTLTTGISDAGAMIYDYWKSAPNRMSEGERRNFYALTMGIPGGSVNGGGNREFNDLWIRFVSSVSQVVRQQTVDELLRSKIPAAINQQQVRKAARDLAYNLSRYTYGMIGYAARDLQDQIMKIIRLLSHPDILRAYGSLDMWQVIDQVAVLELGGARNSARYSTMATCGAIITRWLSLNVAKYNSPTSTDLVIDVQEVLSTFPSSRGIDATKNPTDFDLVNACELWLADTAVSDMRVEEYSQPREAPAMSSRPVQIPSVARELLDQALPPGLGFGMRR